MTERMACKICKRRIATRKLRGGRCTACASWFSRQHTERPPVPVPYPCDGTAACHCVACRAAHAWRHSLGKPRRPKWTQWSAGEETRLRALAGTASPAAIGVQLTEEFGIPRTAKAVHTRCRLLGLYSAEANVLSARQIATICGVPATRVSHSWLRSGALPAQASHAACQHWRITPAEFERFLREYRHLYDWRRMLPGRWRNYAELLWRTDPLLTVADVATQYRVSPRTVRDWIIKQGLPARHVRPGRGGKTMSLVRRSDLGRFHAKRALQLAKREPVAS